MTLRRLGLAAFALLAIALAIQTWRLNRAGAREFAAWVDQQRNELGRAGLQRVKAASQREIARLVPGLKAQLDAATAAGARSILATRFEGKADTIHVPAVPSGAAAPGGEAPPRTMLPPGAPGVAASTGCDVDTWVRLEEAVIADDGGGIYVARAVNIQLQAGDWYSGWRPVKATNLDAPVARVDPELEKAWAAWKAPAAHELDVFVGASLGLDGPGLTGQVSGGRGRWGWFAAGDYVLADPSHSRFSGGAKISIKK